MMLAATIAPTPAPAAHSHLWYDCATVLCVALAALAVLACIYLVFQIWEKQRIIAHYRREEHARANRKSDKGHPAPHPGPLPKAEREKKTSAMKTNPTETLSPPT